MRQKRTNQTTNHGALMRLSEAAESLGISTRSVRILAHDGRLTPVIIGGKAERIRYVTRASVETLLSTGD